MTKRIVKPFLLVSLLTLGISTAYSAPSLPSVEFLPMTATNVQVSGENKIFVEYRLSNPSAATQRLKLSPTLGVTQLLKGEGVCAEKIRLAPKESCYLTLQVDARSMAATIQHGPTLCEASEGLRDSTHCIQPQERDRLHIQRLSAKKAMLSIKSRHIRYPALDKSKKIIPVAFAQLCPVNLIAGTAVQFPITIANNSTTVTAYNIQASNLPAGVTQDASACAVLSPGKSCTILLTAGATAQSTVLVNIQGSNTTTLSILIDVVPALSPTVQEGAETPPNQAWQGGTIYNINSDGSSGQIVANSLSVTGMNATPPQPGLIWGNNTLIGPNAESMSDGQSNTTAIVNELTTVQGLPLTSYAAGLCTTYTVTDSCGITYNDWYLPSVDEMTTLYNSYTNSGILACSSTLGNGAEVWSSTEIDPLNAYQVSFMCGGSSPTPGILLKSSLDPAVICIRQFSYSSY